MPNPAKSDHISENTGEIMHNSINERCTMEEFTKALEYFPDMDEGTKDTTLDNVSILNAITIRELNLLSTELVFAFCYQGKAHDI